MGVSEPAMWKSIEFCFFLRLSRLCSSAVFLRRKTKEPDFPPSFVSWRQYSEQAGLLRDQSFSVAATKTREDPSLAHKNATERHKTNPRISEKINLGAGSMPRSRKITETKKKIPKPKKVQDISNLSNLAKTENEI